MMEDRLTPLASGQEMVALRSMRRGSASPAVLAVMLDKVVVLAVVAGNGGRE